MAKTICTLVKCLFQQTVLSRLARVREGSLRNFTRPVVLAVDEYSDVASEVPGEPMGDGYFFSLARQNGCMGLVATQSVNMLQASSLKENWKAVFSTFGAKIFMRLADNETAEEAQKQAGNSDWYLGSAGQSQQKDGLSMSRNTELRERKTLPTEVLTQVLKSGEAVIVGSLDGSVTKPSTMFLRVPDRGR
jgi:type IV secretory pathway TraG/TraD family ATPase VirD4